MVLNRETPESRVGLFTCMRDIPIRVAEVLQYLRLLR